MTAQEAVNKIASLLLGKDWYSYYTNHDDITEKSSKLYVAGIHAKTKTLLINSEESTIGAISADT